MKKIYRYLFLFLAFVVLFATTCIPVFASADVTVKDDTTTIVIPAPPAEIAVLWGDTPEQISGDLLYNNLDKLISDTYQNGNITIGDTEGPYNQDFKYFSYSGYDHNNNDFGCVSLVFTNSIFSVQQELDYAWLYSCYMQLMTTGFNALQVRYALHEYTDNGIGKRTNSTNWQQPKVYSVVEGTYYYPEFPTGFVSFEGYPVDGSRVFVIDILFLRATSNVNFSLSVSTDYNDIATTLIGKSVEGNPSGLPDGVYHPLYPKPDNDPLLNMDIIKDEAEANSELTLETLRELSLTTFNFVDRLAVGLNNITSIYDSIVDNMPWLDTIITVSLFFGLASFVFGTTSLIIRRRDK